MTTRIDPKHAQFAPAHRTATSARDDRPIAFLVSTTPCGRKISEHLGSPAYSYHFVAEALAPAFRAVGDYRPVDHPESRLALAARSAEAEGFRPIHVAINPLQDVYLSPNLPNLVFPFWEFPRIPDRDFGLDTRQNWARIARGASLVLCACRLTADAFRNANVNAPACVVPIPVLPSSFDLPDWDPRHSWTLTCRHEVLGAGTDDVDRENPIPCATDSQQPVPDRPDRVWRTARRLFRGAMPWLNPRIVARLTLLKRGLVAARGKHPARLAYDFVRDAYRRNLQRWLSPYALARITNARNRALTLVGRSPRDVVDPPLPSGSLTLGGDGGPVYLTIFNVGDERKNHAEILSAFLLAFRDRADATLVIKLVTNRLREHHEAGLLRATYRAMGIAHRCRVVVVTEFLSEEQMQALYRVSSFYVNASFAEGACLPLMRALAGGRPAIAPDHSAMADYIDDTLAFVLRSSPEPIHWPHDPEKRLTTMRSRPLWSDLRDAFLASAIVAGDPPRYATMSRAGRARMARYASEDAAIEALREAIALLPNAEVCLE